MSLSRFEFHGSNCPGRAAACDSPHSFNMARSKLSLRNADSLVRAKRSRLGHTRTRLSALRRKGLSAFPFLFIVVPDRERPARGVYAASAWHKRWDVAEPPRVRELRTLKRPERRAPALILVRAPNTYDFSK